MDIKDTECFLGHILKIVKFVFYIFRAFLKDDLEHYKYILLK